ncbi:MAG: hypothetical protein ACO3CQ_07635, partial [Candidatus Nanopelagicaceae bacterium]
PGSTLVVNAPSGYSGNVLDVQVGGTSQFKVLSSQSYYSTFEHQGAVVSRSFITPRAVLSNDTFGVSNDGTIGFSNNVVPAGANISLDVALRRDAADVLAQRRGLNAQTFRIYNTYTSASQYERAYLGWNNNTFQIGVDTAGISTARSISLVGAAGSNTGDTLAPLQINQTWTAGSGIATAITVNVTDTSSASNSRLLDLRTGGTSRFIVDKSGALRTSDGTFTFYSTAGNMSHYFATNYHEIRNGGANGVTLSVAARGVLELGEGPNLIPQTLRIYNTNSNTANYERAYLGWTSNIFVVGTQTGGIGTARQMQFQTNGTTRVAITTDGYVGIGTTLPTQTLDINGSVRLRDGLYDSNNVVGSDGSVLVSTGVGVSWSSSIQGTQGLQGLSNQGTQGVQGLQGDQGTQGVQGLSNQGTQGVQGVQGLQGDQGTQGLQATQGLQGNQGVQGLQGNQGVQATQGLQGVQGLQGNQGVQATQGLQGVQGLQGNQGVQATQGLQGNQGVQGFQGNQGVQGLQGNQGVQATQGLQGNQGVQATQGLQGVQGRQGLQGVQGFQGLQGVQGVQGNQGVQGGNNGGVTIVDDTSTNSNWYVAISSVTSGIETTLRVSSNKLQINPSTGALGVGTQIDIVPYDTLNSGTLSFEGSAGQLFSITNNLTSGSIFSVNDVSGIPSIDVDADGTVSIVSYGGSLGIGTTNPTRTLDLNGSLRLRDGLWDSNNNVGVARSILISTGIGVSWASPEALQGAQGLQGVQGVQGLQGRQGVQGV